jgi:hypothetical protein
MGEKFFKLNAEFRHSGNLSQIRAFTHFIDKECVEFFGIFVDSFGEDRVYEKIPSVWAVSLPCIDLDCNCLVALHFLSKKWAFIKLGGLDGVGTG